MTQNDAAIHALRGKIVRAIARLGGSTFVDEYIDVMADAGAFNVQYPDIAIPKGFGKLGFYPIACLSCDGVGKLIVPDGDDRFSASQCQSCEGSGFDGLLGCGDTARIKVGSPSSVPRR
jgi:hypothetical protein